MVSLGKSKHHNYHHMRLITTILCSFFLLTQITANDKYDIQFKVNNYDQDTLIIGYYFGGQTLVLDTLVANKPGEFRLQSDTTALIDGIYIALTKPENQFVQFMITDEDQEFKMEFDASNLSDISFKGSKENKIFNDYVKFMEVKRTKQETLQNSINSENTDPTIIAKTEMEIAKVDLEVKNYQDEVLKNHPQSIASLVIKANSKIDLPDFEGTPEEVQMAQYRHYKKHYFDNIDLTHPAVLRTPFLNDRIEYYLEKLTYKMPDSLNQSVDYILDKMEGSEEMYSYYLSHLLRKYGEAKVVGQDAVYVHIAEKYYATGKATWMKPENLEKILENAANLKPTLIGKQAPDFTVQKEDGSSLSLSDMKSKYTVIFFWAPDCGHCTKSIPHIKTFSEKWKDKGVEILTICNKTGKKYESCWEGVKEKGLEEFINTGDQYQKSKILSNYFVKTTPKIFVLDQDHKIIMKGIGAKQLDAVMIEMERQEMERMAGSKSQ